MINRIDLSGKWALSLDKGAASFLPDFYGDKIYLPSTTSYSKRGERYPYEDLGNLTDEYRFEGNAWYKREITLEGISDKTVKLFLERTRITTVYFDGLLIGKRDSIIAPHIYDLSGLCTDGEHTLTICVSNVGYKTLGGHMTSPDTQTNWNGILGRIELLVCEKNHVEELKVTPNPKKKTVLVEASVAGDPDGTAKIYVESVNGPLTSNNQRFSERCYKYNDGKLSVEYPLGYDALLWSEFEPNLYKLCVSVGGDKRETVFGLREFCEKGDKFLINGKKTFLRGKHDGMVFPKTGYAPTDVDSWLKVMGVARDWGINHYRFHTCCPPDAAFLAADMLGIYMEPELPFWGVISATDEEGYNEVEQDYLIKEGERMLKAFGNHPSFCMMSLGNELWGSPKRLNDIIGIYKANDRRCLYTQGSNNFQFFPQVAENDDFFCGVRLSADRLLRGSFAACDVPHGHIQTDRPSTMKDYDLTVRPTLAAAQTVEADENGMVKIQYGTEMKLVKATEADADFIPDVPIVTHEVGQYVTYPNFDQIEKYTGPLKPKSIEIFKKRLEDAGLGELAKDYFYASGKLAAACYKEELETIFRSRYLGGFQLLDLQDFPGQGMAFVGMLDSFMESKGILTESEWRSFCAETVALARFPSYTLVEGETFTAALSVTDFSNKPIKGMKFHWSVTSGKEKLADGAGEIGDGENFFDLGRIDVKLPEKGKSYEIKLKLGIDLIDVKNEYTLYVYPKDIELDADGVYVLESAESDKAKELLSDGKTILVVPKQIEGDDFIKGFYCQDFWCYPMFRTISESMKKPLPIGTMGLLIDNKHESLKGFPSEIYSTEQWWDIVENSASEVLDGRDSDKKIIVRTIDNFERNHSLGLLYEYQSGGGKVVVLNCDIDAVGKTPNGRQFIKSVFDYVRN